jgi:thiamine pyrophosphokinase
MNTNRVIIVTNGILDRDIIKNIKSDDFIIGVDHAAYWLITQNIIPNLAIGDFDSTNKKELLNIKKLCPNTKVFSSKKDFTDTELAVLEAIKLKPKNLIIYGATGNRIDHTLANIFLLEKLQKHSIPSYIKDSHNEIYLINRSLILKKEKSFPFISILPLTNSVVISLSGFAYNLDHKTIVHDQSIGISNQIIKNSATITVHSGKAIIIKSRD